MTIQITVSLNTDDNASLQAIMQEYKVGSSKAIRKVFEKARANNITNIRKKDAEINLLKDLIIAVRNNDKDTDIYLTTKLKDLYKSEAEGVINPST